MDLTIRINGELIDGVSANSVKLTINNPDPLKFTEQTVSYSGTINIPRSEVTTGYSVLNVSQGSSQGQPHTAPNCILEASIFRSVAVCSVYV